MRAALPVDAIEEMFVLPPERIISTAGKDSFEWEGEIVQLVKLSQWLHFNCPISLESPEITPAISTPTVVLVQYNQRLVGIQVDRSWGEQEVALRRVAGNLPMPKGFNSCTIMGDGQVVPLVNIPELLYWIASCEADGKDSPESTIPAYLPAHYSTDPALKPPRKPTVLLIDDSINVRRLLALTLEKNWLPGSPGQRRPGCPGQAHRRFGSRSRRLRRRNAPPRRVRLSCQTQK